MFVQNLLMLLMTLYNNVAALCLVNNEVINCSVHSIHVVTFYTWKICLVYINKLHALNYIDDQAH